MRREICRIYATCSAITRRLCVSLFARLQWGIRVNWTVNLLLRVWRAQRALRIVGAPQRANDSRDLPIRDLFFIPRSAAIILKVITVIRTISRRFRRRLSSSFRKAPGNGWTFAKRRAISWITLRSDATKKTRVERPCAIRLSGSLTLRRYSKVEK